ncbi:MAG TPA: dipeptide ABC transporter ATP-binding protein DppD, partial [Verrucomicrobia bacterium]|nr:dipeptide ABC transporter ATP-binding protein DppD [Verrucomicrobiota bacterium]
GESGSGKSMSALAVTKITPRAAQYKGGRIRLNGLDDLSLSERDLCKIRG